MKVTIKTNYLIFPVNTLLTNKRLTFFKNNKIVYGLNIKLDYCNPNFYAYIDVSRFIGQTLDIDVSPKMKLDFKTSNDINIDNLYNEPLRPQLHFTTKNGWINDPNGLIFKDGIYHMFYQYNPTESNWENMHWGHATSKDLFHWVEQKIALFPDERGTMFSGSGILDEKNLLGKNTDGNKAALLFYTTTNPFSQCLSYSVDDFKTIKRYENNPLIPHIVDDNRDPKVVFCEELNCYILALYLKDDIYCIFKSNDLVNWTELQRLSLIGDNECPDIFPLMINGMRKWVFTGAHGKYLIGEFKNNKFEQIQEVISQHFGDSIYACQTFSNVPNGRIIQIAWDRWNIPADRFNGQMGIPTELSLTKFKDKYYLEAQVVKEIETLYRSFETYENIIVSSDNNFKIELKPMPYIFKINDIKSNKITKLQVFGRDIYFDFNENKIKIGKNIAPLSYTKEKNNIVIIVDRCSIEIFSDSGKIYMSCLNDETICDFNMPYFVIEDNNKTKIKNLEVHSLNSIWK